MSLRTAVAAFLSIQMGIGAMAFGAGLPVAGLDPLIYVQEGWQWGAFQDEESTIDASDSGITLDIQPAAGGDWPGTTNGGIGISFVNGNLGALDLDMESHQLEINFRVLPDNEADAFRVVLEEPDSVEINEEFQYYFNGLLDYDENEWITITRPLTDLTATWPPEGDQMMSNLGNIQLGMWEQPGPLNIELGSILISPLEATTPPNVVFEWNASKARRGWTWGAFGDEESTVTLDDTIDLNIQPAAGGDYPGEVTGGLGSPWIRTDIGDPEDYEIVVKAKLGPDNEATSFTVELFDNDELNEIIEWDPRELDQFAEKHQYTFSTEELSEDEFLEIRQSLTDPGPTWIGEMGNGSVAGDGQPNFGLYGVQINSIWQSIDALDLEIESIRIVDTTFTIPCDMDGNGACDADDIDTWTVAKLEGDPDPKFDLDGNGVLDEADYDILIHDLFETYIGDTDLNHEFDSADFVAAFVAGKYETGEEAGWAIGDWNADLIFDSGDFVAAFVDGGYEQGAFVPGNGVNAVPEPSSIVLLSIAMLALAGRTRRTR